VGTVSARIGPSITVFALCLSLGLHWLALQSVAWTTMLVVNARHAPLSEAVKKTFDGNHPCDLCHAVAEGKKSENKSEVLPTIAKIDLICTTQTIHCFPPLQRYQYGPAVLAVAERIERPPVPPPRVRLG
jgi:hypothetical protein